MKKYEVEKIRNVGIFGHGGDGKTSLADAILFDTGMNNRMGRVTDGSSLLDFEPEEIDRKISISAAIAYYEWDKHRVVLVDTPGDANFIFDAKACMRVVEGGVFVIGANSGVKVQTEAMWAEALKLPRIIFVSKMDVERARFAETVDDIRERLSSPQPLPLQFPIGKEKDFTGVVDLLGNKAYIYEGDATGKYREEAIPQELAAEAQQQRVKAIEALVEMDDALMEKYLEGAEVSLPDLHRCLKKGTLEGKIAPVVCGSSVKNIGMHPLLDVINICLPSPAEVAVRRGKNPRTGEEEQRQAKEDAPFSAYVFKTITDPFTGRLTLFRVYSGGISADTTLHNATKDAKERVGQIFMLQGKKQDPVGFAGPGDIVAVAKLKETTTGDTLCNEKNPIVFEGATPPPAVMSYAIRPKAKGDEEKIATSLPKLMEEDPTITISRDLQTKEIILSCMGQVHVDVVLEKLKRKFGVEVDLDVPKVPYKETIKKAVKGIIYRHKKQTGGRGQFAEVHFDIFPLERGKGFEFENALTGMNVPRNFVPAVEKGIVEAITTGVLAGYPVVDVKVRFFDGKSHEVDSSEMAFKIASIMAFKKGVRDASPIFLEPIMKIEIVVPEDHVGDVIGDLNGRRGRILGVEAKGHNQIVKANVPMAEVLRYAPDLISMTGGRGQFAEVHFDIFPLERGKGFEFENALTGMNVPRNFVPAVEKGIVEAITTGVLAGYPVVDVKVRFYDGKSHEVDSSEMAFKIASIMAFKKGVRDASPIFLEPIMEIEIAVPEDHVGDVIGDLNGRRGRILGVESKGHTQVVKANIPMAEVLRYAPDLISMTGGKGSFTLEYSHYEEVPANIAERMVAEAQKEKEEE